MRVRLLIAFSIIYVVWGSTYLCVAIALRSFPPLMLMCIRCLAGGTILLLWGALRERDPLTPRTLLLAIVCGLLFFVGCHGVLALAQRHVPSGLAAVMLATIPFWIALLRLLLPGRRAPSRSVWLALGAGFAGVGVIAWAPSSSGAIDAFWLAALLGSSLSWALATVAVQNFGGTKQGLRLSGIELLSGGVVLAALSAGAGEAQLFRPDRISGSSLVALAYLTIAGTVVAFSVYVWLLDRVQPTLVATYTFVNPVVAVVLGWLFLDEQPSMGMLIGAPLTIGAVCVAWRLEQRNPTRRTQKRRDLVASSLSQGGQDCDR
ncbi:EamA family transporter [Burkholderia sp. JPY481]|uniref:EamA family transporter n=1 Tax=Paraburkholderia sp. JPY465 TaxID=3042285 RepID=UPI003172E828